MGGRREDWIQEAFEDADPIPGEIVGKIDASVMAAKERVEGRRVSWMCERAG